MTTPTTTPTTVKRSQFAAFLNVGTATTPQYALIGEGVTTATINYNPQIREETYIHQDSASKDVERYAPEFPLEQTCKAGDGVFDFIDGLRQARAVEDAAKTDVVLVYLYESPTGDAYPAERQPVSVAIESFGGDGGVANKINYSLNFVGDPTPGTFAPKTKTFTANT
jgi:hypothetical protein